MGKIRWLKCAKFGSSIDESVNHKRCNKEQVEKLVHIPQLLVADPFAQHTPYKFYILALQGCDLL